MKKIYNIRIEEVIIGKNGNETKTFSSFKRGKKILETHAMQFCDLHLMREYNFAIANTLASKLIHIFEYLMIPFFIDINNEFTIRYLQNSV